MQKKTGVAEKEPNEALQAKRSTSEFGDFSARASFLLVQIILQNSVEQVDIDFTLYYHLISIFILG